MTICINPRDKDQFKYAEFMQKGMTLNFSNEYEFQTLLEEVYFTKPEEIVFALSIGTDYTTALNRAKEIPIKPPFVEITVVDLVYFAIALILHILA
jgi:hypothetical protein